MRAKVHINLDNISYNIDKIAEKTSIDKFMAVVKADAYGCGINEIVKFCIKKGIKWYGVATFEEAMQIYRISKDLNILILSPVEKNKYKKLAEKNIHFTVCSFDEIEYIKQNNIKANIHVAFDTGMGRIGFNKNHIEEAIKLSKPVGIFTHLSSAEDDEDFAKNQLKIFDEIVCKYDIKYKHALNSFGTYKLFNPNYDLYRIGVIMYGEENTDDFKDSVSFFARVCYIKKLEYDSNIGYSNTYKAKKGDIIATISAGYADGVNRKLSNNYSVYSKGGKYKIIGNICMDQFMILADENLKVGDYVEIFGENISIHNFANICDSISYEVLCKIGKRVKRIYKGAKI